MFNHFYSIIFGWLFFDLTIQKIVFHLCLKCHNDWEDLDFSYTFEISIKKNPFRKNCI